MDDTALVVMVTEVTGGLCNCNYLVNLFYLEVCISHGRQLLDRWKQNESPLKLSM